MTALRIVDLLVRFVLWIQLIRVIIQIGTIRRIVRIVLIRPIIQLLLGVSLTRDFAAAHVYLLSEPKKTMHLFRAWKAIQLVRFTHTKTRPTVFPRFEFLWCKAMKHRGTTKSHTQLLSTFPSSITEKNKFHRFTCFSS